MTYFLYLFTNLIPAEEDRYFIGWVFNCIVGVLIIFNLAFMIYDGLKKLLKVVRNKCH
jgi:hypothetical protein